MTERITQDRLRALLIYEPDTGLFRWLVDRGGERAGSVAGNINHAGYIRITIDGKSYRAHHLAWFWMTGVWPKKIIDHRDLDKGNNRWRNLREATKSQNMANGAARKNNKGGLKGAYYYKANNNYQSCIRKDGRTIYLGYFKTAEEAHAAYCKAASELFGEFARAA